MKALSFWLYGLIYQQEDGNYGEYELESVQEIHQLHSVIIIKIVYIYFETSIMSVFSFLL